MATRRTTGSSRTSGSSPQPPENDPSRRRAAPVGPPPASSAPAGSTVSGDARRAMVAQAAYLRAERRGFAGGDEVEDWLAAEAEVDALLRAGHGRPPQ